MKSLTLENRTDELSPTPLSTRVVGSRVHIYDELDSTNARAFRIGGDGTVVVADSQTAGRGRHGRAWQSDPGLGLWFSVVFDETVPGLAFAGPLAVRDALRTECAAKLKWPNDVLVDGRKICGILVETRGRRTVLGIGINVRHRPEDFPPDLRDRATSIEALCGRTIHRGTLLRRVLTELDQRVVLLRDGHLDATRREWAAACAIRGLRVRAGEVEGIVRDIADDGGLLIENETGSQRIVFGDVVELSGD